MIIFTLLQGLGVLGEQTCPEIMDLSRNKGLFLRYGASGGDGISGRVVVFLHAFITSGRPGGRAGGGRMAKLFLDTSSGERAGGQAAKVISAHIFSKIISGHVSGRAGGRADRLAKLFLDASCYFWTRRGISARVHNEPAAGRAGEGRMAKLFLDTSSGERAGGQAAQVISGHVFSKIISGHVSGRAGRRADRLAKLFLDASCYFWTRRGISARVLLFLDASWYFCTRS